MKRNAKRILCLLLALGMIFPLAACMPQTPQNTTTGTVPPTTTGPQVTTDPYRTDVGTLSFSSVSDLSEYTVVLSELASAELKAATKDFVARLADKTGVTLLIQSDVLMYGQSAPTDAKEILIGATNRQESFDALRYNDFRIEKRGNRIVIAGGSDASLEKAFDELFAVEAFFAGQTLMVPNAAYDFKDAYAIEKLLLGGVSIDRYTIVRDADNKETALYLQEKICEWTGHLLPLKTAEVEGDLYEIVVGNVRRDELSSYPEEGKYLVNQIGTKVFLGGSSVYAGYFAVMDFLNENIVKAPTASTLSISLSEKVASHRKDGLHQTNMGEVGSLEGKYSTETSSDTVFDRFQLAKDELPDEITVLEPLKVEDFPFSQKRTYYVSAKTGDDENDGLSPKTPFETIARALRAVQGKKGGVIYLMEGTYEQRESLKILESHSGTMISPLFIKNYEKDKVTLTTNRIFDNYDSGAWQVVDYASDPVADRLPDRVKNSGDDIYYASLADLGLTPSDMAEITQTGGAPKLYVGETAYNLARFPNETIDSRDLLYFTHVYDTGTVSATTSGLYVNWAQRCAASGISKDTVIGWQIRLINEKDNAKDNNSEGWSNAQELADEVTSWVNTGNIWYSGNTYEGWETGYYNISLNEEGVQNWHYSEDGERLLGGWRDDANGITVTSYDRNGKASQKTGYYFLKSKHPSSNGCGPSKNSAAGRNTFYLFNAIEAMDVPGEWFYDKTTGIIYLYPTEEFFNGDDIMYSGGDAHAAIESVNANASYVVIDGITVDGSADYGIRLTYTDSFVLQNLTVKNTVKSNVHTYGSTNLAILYSDFSRCYDDIMVQVDNNTTDSVRNLDFTNNVIQNNVFHDPFVNSEKGLAMGGYRAVASHNFFKDCFYHTGLAVECVIEYNRFDGGSLSVIDGGMMYLGGGTARGNHCRYNLCHMFKASHRAFYCDTQCNGNYCYGNIISTIGGMTQSTYNAWYSSSGNGNVCFGNIILLRNPMQRAEADNGASGEETGVSTHRGSGDNLHQSSLFYYFYSDNGYSATGNATRYIFSYTEEKEIETLKADIAALEAKVKDESATAEEIALLAEKKLLLTEKSDTKGRTTYKQNLAAHWWKEQSESEFTNHMEKFNSAAWYARFPDYMNYLHGVKLILEAYRQTDYSVRYFYLPQKLSGQSFTYTDAPEGTTFTIPEYTYLDENGEEVTVAQHVVGLDENGSVTLTYEEIAAMERMDRAPSNCVISNNIILGGTPATLDKDGEPVGNEVKEESVLAIDERLGFDTRASTMTVGNFMYYDYMDIIPGADGYDYEIPDEAWEKIETAMQSYDPDYKESFSLIINEKYGGGFGVSDPQFNYWQYD